MNPIAAKVLNVALYQSGWFCCVLGAAWDHPLSGALGALVLLVVHLLLACRRRAELLLMLLFCLIGVTIDSLQQALGGVTFKIAPAWPLWLPPWVFAIWAQFATLFHYALRWMAGHYLLAALCGAVGGPLAYGGGVKLGAAFFGENPYFSLACLALIWALLTPALFWLSDRIDPREGEYRGIGSR